MNRCLFILSAAGVIFLSFSIEIDPANATWPKYTACGLYLLVSALGGFVELLLSTQIVSPLTNPTPPGDSGSPGSDDNTRSSRLLISLQGLLFLVATFFQIMHLFI